MLIIAKDNQLNSPSKAWLQ